jgi:type IX secretion system PorP/SprF family membrane protein
MAKNIQKATLISIILMISITVAKSQQDPMFAEYMFNQVTVNPGYAGSGEVANVMVLERQQWAGFDGAPKTFNLAANAPLRKISCGVGASLLVDKIGPTKQTGFFVDYSYQLKVSEKAKLGMGLKAGFTYYKANLLDIQTTEDNDVAFARNIDGDVKANFGIGFFYYTKTFYAGFSIPKLMNNDLTTGYSVNNEKLSLSQRHYYFIAGKVFDLNSKLKFRPSLLTKINKGAPLQVDLTANFIYAEKIWLGAMYRIGDAVGFMIQIQILKTLRVGYAYDLTTTYLSRYNRGSHEIMVSFDFFTGKNKIRSPRYF